MSSNSNSAISHDDTDEDDEETAKKARFSRFVSEKKPPPPLKSGSSSLLDNLLSGQVRLLEKGNAVAAAAAKTDGGDGDAKEGKSASAPPRVRYRGEELGHLQAGCGRLADYRPPAAGANVNYRVWNLWDKARPASNLRLLVRCKVGTYCVSDTKPCKQCFGSGSTLDPHSMTAWPLEV
jgi:hypothetical protein